MITSHCKLELLKKSHYLLTDPRIYLVENFFQGVAKKKGLHFESVLNFMIFVSKTTKKEGVQIESLFAFWRDFCEMGGT